MSTHKALEDAAKSASYVMVDSVTILSLLAELATVKARLAGIADDAAEFTHGDDNAQRFVQGIGKRIRALTDRPQG